MEKAISQKPILGTIRAQLAEWIRHPQRLFVSRPVHIMCVLYAATFTVANTSDTILRSLGGSVPAEPLRVAATLLVNVPLGIWKDVRFTQMFGSGKAVNVPRPRPTAPAMAAFLMRDCMTIFGGFCLPGLLTGPLANHTALGSSAQAAVVAQLVAPPLVQVVATPVHLHAVGLCAGNAGLQKVFTVSTLAPATMARCLRVIPPFGVGCLVNTEVRVRFAAAEFPGTADRETL